MKKKMELKDQTEILIREMTRRDLDRSLAFFAELPQEDRNYLRRDVTRPDIVEERIVEIESGAVQRLVALDDDGIVAEGSLECSGEGWKKPVGELRLIGARPYRRKGLGVLMAREMYGLAAAAKVEEIIVKMMRPQKAAQSIFRRLGFHRETILPDYVSDLGGMRHDMILMRCDLEALWQEMEDFLASGDWQRTR